MIEIRKKTIQNDGKQQKENKKLTLEFSHIVVVVLIVQVGIGLEIKHDIIYSGVTFIFFCGFCTLISHKFIPIAGAIHIYI